MKTTSVACPTCGQPVPWTPESKYRPFCSERCKLIDLGEWAQERYRVPSEPAKPWETEVPTDDDTRH